MLLFIDKNGRLLNGNVPDFMEDSSSSGYVDISENAHKYLSWDVKFLGDVTLRSLISLIEKNQILQTILVDHCPDKFIAHAHNYPVQKPDTIGRDLTHMKIYRDGEFNFYKNSLEVYPVPYLLGYVDEVNESVKSSVAVGLDFHPVEELLDKKIVLDGVFTAQAECLLNSPMEQEDITLEMPNFTLLEVLECVFSELYPNGEENLVTLKVDDSSFFKSDVPSLKDFSWFNDGPQKGIVFSEDFNGEKEMVFTLLDMLLNDIVVDKFLKKFFGDTVQVKPGLEGCNAYEFRVRVYGESVSLLPSEKMQQKKKDGKSIRKDKLIFNPEFLSLWNEFGFDVEPESMLDCLNLK